MNKKGFSLIELLGYLAIFGIILCIGLYSAKGTLATTLSTLNDISVNEIYSAAKTYISENKITWVNDGIEHTCITISALVDSGYFKENEVITYKDKLVEIIRDPIIKVITNTTIVEECN